MPSYKTPGVYVEEISTLPPSVAEVATAIPAFLGYTERGSGIQRINTLLEFEAAFGGPYAFTFNATTTIDSTSGLEVVDTVQMSNEGVTHFVLYYALRHYFQNGGGSCYVVSVGNYDASPQKADFEAGLADLEKEDEPTLILFPEALLIGTADYLDLCQQALAQCEKLKDRFLLCDIISGGDEAISAFRNGIGNNNLAYGAAYYPGLETTLTFAYEDRNVNVDRSAVPGDAQSVWSDTFGDNGIQVRFSGAEGSTPRLRIVSGTAGNPVAFAIDSQLLTISDAAGKTGDGVADEWQTWSASNDAQGFSVTANGDGSGPVPNTANANVDLPAVPGDSPTTTMADLRTTSTALYNQLRARMASQRVVMSASPSVAGAYATVDRNRGVWKAPANVSLNGVIRPLDKVTHEQQERMNVDPTAGKSINAIRAFTGKGILIWGARTLAGNDNEWRYVPVRRLFNMIEESTQKATAFAVFEPNDATTWLKVKAMIESYLYGLWEQGALAGPTPESAYFVNVGLGTTMTPQDVLEGRMIVEIGVAAVRPAEFIILRFSHMLQQA